MAAMEISGHNQLYRHVMTSFEQTNDLIEANSNNESMTDEIKEKIYQDFSSTLVLILDNMGRQKAIAALEIYREHEKFRKNLEQMQDGFEEAPLEAQQATMQNGDVHQGETYDFPLAPQAAEEQKETVKNQANKIGMSKKESDKKERKAGKKKQNQTGYNCAQGIFREAFEEIMDETVNLSHYVTNCYRSYKQNANQTDLRLKELTDNFTTLASFKEKQIKQAEEQIRQNQHNKDNSVLEGVKEWYDKMNTQLRDAKTKFQDDQGDLINVQKRQHATLSDLEDLVDDLVDEVITSLRREHTNFDNNWLPSFEFNLDAPSSFVKFVGMNTILCQDNRMQLYFFSADELELRSKQTRKFKAYDALGNDRFIMVALDKRNIQVFDRTNYEVVKQLRPSEQIMAITFNQDRYFQCVGLNGYRVFYDVQRGFKSTNGEQRNHDIMSARASAKFGEQFGLQAEDEILCDVAYDKWIKIDEQRESFYKFAFVQGDQERVIPVRLKGLDFLKIRHVVASPYFGINGNFHVAYMDSEGIVQLVEVELLEGEFNEGLTLSPFAPTNKYIDLYGAKDMETVGQCLTSQSQNELYLVGVKAPSGKKPAMIWLKHYKHGILNEDDGE